MNGAEESPLAIHALLVDDDPLLLALMSAFLEERGYTVQHAAHGVDALERLRHDGRINLVITDRHMPEMDGLALSAAIRRLPSPSYRYCVMLTSSAEEDSLVAAMDAGVDDFIAKPLRLPELGARLHAAERVLRLEATLASRNERLEQAYRQLSRELELARELQLAQLPPPAAIGRVRFEWTFEASSFVGGDTFDYFELDPRHLCFWMADVSGHGAAAAMMAFNAQQQIRAATHQRVGRQLARGDIGAACAAVAREVNSRWLAMKDSGMYLTLILGFLHLETGRVAFAQAGHPAPLLLDGAGGCRAIGDGGLPVGIVADAQFPVHELQLPPGSRLVLYSDGVTECNDAAGAQFGEQRLMHFLQEHCASPLADCGTALLAALHQWRGGAAFDDDVSWLALEMG